MTHPEPIFLEVGDIILNETCFASAEYTVVKTTGLLAQLNNDAMVARQVGSENRVYPIKKSEDPFETYSLLKKPINH